MMKYFKNTKKMVLGIVCATIIMVVGVLSTICLVNLNKTDLDLEPTKNSNVTSADILYDDYLKFVLKDARVDGNHYFSFNQSSGSDKENLGINDDLYTINCDYLTISDTGEVEYGMDGLITDLVKNGTFTEKNISPSNFKLQVEDGFNSGNKNTSADFIAYNNNLGYDKSKFVKFQLEPIKGTDFDGDDCNMYYISEIVVKYYDNNLNREVSLQTISGSCSEGVISYTGKDLAIHNGFYVSTYNMNTENISYFFKFSVDKETGLINYIITTANGGELKHDFIFDVRVSLRDKVQDSSKNKLQLTKDGVDIKANDNATNLNGSILDISDGAFFSSERLRLINNPSRSSNKLNCYTTDDQLIVNLVTGNDLASFKTLSEAHIGAFVTATNGTKQYTEWFTIYGGVYGGLLSDKRFYFNETITASLVKKGVLERTSEQLDAAQEEGSTYTNYYYKLADKYSLNGNIVEIEKNKSYLLLNSYNNCVYIEYSDFFVESNKDLIDQQITIGFDRVSDYIDGGVVVGKRFECLGASNQYTKFEMIFFNDGRIRLYKTALESSMYINYTTQNFYVVSLMSKPSGSTSKSLSGIPYDKVYIRVTSGGSSIINYDFVRSAESSASGRTDAKVGTFFAGVGKDEFKFSANIVLGKNYLFDESNGLDTTKLREVEVNIGGENKRLKLQYVESNATIGNREFIGRVNSDNITDFVLKINLKLVDSKGNETDFNVPGTTITTSGMLCVGSVGSPTIIGSGFNSQTVNNGYKVVRTFSVEKQADGNRPWIKLNYSATLPSGYVFVGGSYKYTSNEVIDTTTHFDNSSYGINQDAVGVNYLGIETDENGEIIVNDSVLEITLKVTGISIELPLYVEYDSNIYENYDEFAGKIINLTGDDGAIRYNLSVTDRASLKIGKSGNGLYKLVGNIKIQVETVSVLGISVKSVSVYFKEFGTASEYKKLDLGNSPEKDGYAFLGVYTSLEGLSDGAEAGIAHFGNTNHDGLLADNLITSSGLRLVLDSSSKPSNYELFIDGQFFSYSSYTRHCEDFERKNLWEEKFNLLFKKVTGSKVMGRVYASSDGVASAYTGSEVIGDDGSLVYGYELKIDTLQKVTAFTKNSYYFDKNGYSSIYTGDDQKNDSSWKARYCYTLTSAKNNYSYNSSKDTSEKNIELLLKYTTDTGKVTQRFFKYSELTTEELKQEWSKVFNATFVETKSAISESNVLYVSMAGETSSSFESGKYCYVMRDEECTCVYFNNIANSDYLYLNKLDAFIKNGLIDTTNSSYVVAYAMFDAICNEKQIIFKDYNYGDSTAEESPAEINIVADGYIYTDTDFLVIEHLIYEQRVYKIGNMTSITETTIPFEGGRIEYKSFPVNAKDYALELYPIANPEYIAKGKRIYYFTTSKDDFDANKRTANSSFVLDNGQSRYFMDEDYLTVDRKRVLDKAVYHLGSYYKDGNKNSTWYVVPTSIKYEFSIVGVDAERRVDSETVSRVNYTDKGNYEVKYVENIPYGVSISDLVGNFIEKSITDKLSVGNFKGNLLGVFDNASIEREIKVLKLRGYDLVGLIPFSSEYLSDSVLEDTGFDTAVTVNIEFLSRYFGLTDDEIQALENNYYTRMGEDAELNFNLVMEAVSRLTKTEYFIYAKKVASIFGVHIDKVTNAMLVESFLNENALKGLGYNKGTTEEGDAITVGMYTYHTELLKGIIEQHVSDDFLKAQRFITVENFEESNFSNVLVLRPDGEGKIACDFNYCRNVVFIPIFTTKNSNLQYDGVGKALLDGDYLLNDEMNNRVTGKYGQNVKSIIDPDTGETLGYTYVDITDFSVSAVGYKTGNIGDGTLDPASSLNSILGNIIDRLKHSIRINKLVRVDDILAISIVPEIIQNGFYASGINLIWNKGTMYESSIRIINFDMAVNGEQRTYEYTASLNSEFFEIDGDYYKLRSDLTEEQMNIFNQMAGFVYASSEGYLYWDMLESVDIRVEYTPFKYNVSFSATSEDDEMEEKDISSIGMLVTNDFSSENFATGDYLNRGIKIGDFINLTDTIYGGSNVYVFNTLKFIRPVIKNGENVYTEGDYDRYLSNGVFIKTILVEYTSLFGDRTERHTGVQFTIKTDKYGLPQVVEKRIVKVIVNPDGTVSFDSEEITADSVGEAILDGLNYDFKQDTFTFDIEALSNADNSINSINFKFMYDYKSYVLSFNAGLYHITSFDGQDLVLPLDPSSLTELSTMYYVVKYNTRNDPKTWLPSDSEGVLTGEVAGWKDVEMLGNGGVIDFTTFTLERIVEITTSYDKLPRFFAYWVRDVRGAGYITPTGDDATYEELGIYDYLVDSEGNPILDADGNEIWQLPNVFDSESGGSFDYYTLFMDEADINVYYYTWNGLKNPTGVNGYTRTAHKGYFFGKEKEYKDFFTVNAYEYYTFGNSNEKYYITGWLKVYDNILTKTVDGNIVLDEFTLYYFLNQDSMSIIGDTKMNKFFVDSTGKTIFVPSLDESAFSYTLTMNQKFSVKKRDTVDENLGAINIYMYAIYAKVDFDVTEDKVVTAESAQTESITPTTYVPNTVEMGNIRGKHLESEYQFATFGEMLGKLNSVSNVKTYWAKINYMNYSNLYGKYFTIKDMLNSGELNFEVLKDSSGNLISGKIMMTDIMSKLSQGEVLVMFYSRLPEIEVTDNGIKIDGTDSNIIAGAIMVGTRSTDSFLFKQFKELNLNADGTVIGVLDEVAPLEVGTDYYTSYINAVNTLKPIKDNNNVEYKKREILVRTALQLAKWNADTTTNFKYRFRFSEDGSFVFDLGNSKTIEQLKQLIEKMAEVKASGNEKTEYIDINSASFVRLVYAIASLSFAESSGVDAGSVYFVMQGEDKVSFNGENTKVLKPTTNGETVDPSTECKYDANSIEGFYYTAEDEEAGIGINGGLKGTNLIAGDICYFTKTETITIVDEEGVETEYTKTTCIFTIYLGININSSNNTNSVYLANNNSIGGFSISKPSNGCSLSQAGVGDETKVLSYLAGAVDLFTCFKFIRVYNGETI